MVESAELTLPGQPRDSKEQVGKMIRLLLQILKHIPALVPGIAATKPAAAGDSDLRPEVLAERKEQLARIEAIVWQQFGQSIPGVDRERFLRVGTLVPLTPASGPPAEPPGGLTRQRRQGHGRRDFTDARTCR